MNPIMITSVPDDHLLGYAELTRDLLFHKIPVSKRRYYVEQALNIGKQQAQTYRLLYKHDLRALCQDRNIQIQLEETSGVLGKVRFRAQFEWSTTEKKIILYRSSLQELQQCTAILPSTKPLLLEHIIDIHLAHELFHAIECDEIGQTYERLEPIDTFKLGRFRRQAWITRTSEIAAHAFCKEWMNLNWLPNMLDYAHFMYSDVWSVQHFEQQVQQWNTELDEH